jgi:hypothetical protein
MADSTSSSERERGLELANRRLANENAEQKKRLDQQDREIQELKQQLARAQRTSQNSSKRPSSDIVKPRQPKPAGGRKIGAQPGHAKHERPPFAAVEIRPIRNYALACCPHCQGPVTIAESILPTVLQQIEIVAQPVEITEHRARWYWCEKCRQLHCPLPPSVEKGGLCGPLPTAWIGYLKGGCHASFSTIRKFLRDVLNVSICRGMLAKAIAKVCAALATPWEELRQLLRKRLTNTVPEMSVAASILFCGLPVLRQQLVDSAGGMRGDFLQHILEVFPGVDAMAFAGADQRVQDRGAAAAFVAAHE